ncbi:MAG: glycogen synthase GlgA [Pirellulaceae bacterium]|nr:glycogen synthase GlgA [Pirellulaceae bacterium]
MNIVYLTTEAVPFAKTGGLADVCGTLPAKIASLGHRAAVVMPAFRGIRDCGMAVHSTDISFAVAMSDQKLVGARLLQSTLPDSEVPVWFIDQPRYFDRDGLYGDASGDYADNAERFSFFCRAALQAISRMGWMVDIVNCNDWQSGLVPALMKNMAGRHPWVAHAKSVMTIHNLAYQGLFSKHEYHWIGQDWIHFHPDQFEYYDGLNFLKTGIVTADTVTTVSPTYAKEIRTPEQGCGLDGVLASVADRITGITNGIDLEAWNPATDRMLRHHYDATNWRQGKTANKLALQQHFGMAPNGDVPLIGLVGRLAEQKGWDLIVPVLRRHLMENRPTQWVVLGSGDAGIEAALKELAETFPDRFGLHVGFSDELAHRIEASSDLFVMPSHYEPCGLNQMYSLRYGTIPIVTATGGLADTVVDCTAETLADGTATGFCLRDSSVDALDDAIGRALQLRYHSPEKWEQLIQTAMSQDWSWRKSASQYLELYERTISLSASEG